MGYLAGAGAVVEAGSKIYSEAQKKKAAGKIEDLEAQAVPIWEKRFNRGTARLLDQERRVMQTALQQADVMQPELYRLLGFEPVFDTQGSENVAAFEQRVASLQEKLAGVKNPNGKRGKALRRQLQKAEDQLLSASSTPKRIKELRPLEPGQTPDPTGMGNDLMRVALDLQNQSLVRALRGEEPIDATLRTEYEERERDLRDRLRAHLGSDYETSTAGRNALANFSREKAEAFESFNRQAIKDFSALTESRARTLSDLTSERMKQLLGPSQATAQGGEYLSKAAGDRGTFTAGQRAERQRLDDFEVGKAKALAGIYGQGAPLVESAGKFAGGVLSSEALRRYAGGLGGVPKTSGDGQPGPWSGGYAGAYGGIPKALT